MIRRYLLTAQRRVLPHHPLLTVHRWSSTLSNEEIIARSDWKSKSYFTRLGISGTTNDMDMIKRHYHVLAGHFHPDSPNGSAEAFVEIKAAFDGLNAQNGFQGTNDSGMGGGWSGRMRDGNRRGDMSRVYGDAIPLFFAGCLFLLLLVYYHNKHRLGHGYLSHLLGIFVILQFFPRVMAALVIFSFHFRDLLDLKRSESQRNTVLQLEKGPKAGQATVSVLGISEEDSKHCVMETTVEERQGNNEVSRRTFTTPKGGPLSTPVTYNQKGPAQCFVKVIQEDTKLVLTDTVATLA